MQYSPKLKKAMDEIKDILKKHDIAGCIALHTPGFSEFTFQISPSYSIAKVEGMPDGNYGLRLRARKADIPNDDERIQKVADTSNMFKQLDMCLTQLWQQAHYASELIDDITDAKHGDTNFTSPLDQDN